jgi:hypothetical protein
MKIQSNTDKTIIDNEEHEDYFSAWVTDAIKRYESHLSKIEVHVSGGKRLQNH